MTDLIKHFDAFKMGDMSKLATATNISLSYLSQIKNGHIRCSTDLAKLLEQEAEKMGLVLPKSAIRPDVWDSAA